MKKIISFLIFFTALCEMKTQAQFTRYIIRLKNKTGTPYNVNNPSQFLSQRSISRRARYSIAIDQTDLPITPRYIDSIRSVPNVIILNYSKWLNQVCILTSDAAALSRINAFDFVLSSSAVAARQINGSNTNSRNKNGSIENIFFEPAPASVQNTNDYYSYGASYDQVHLHNAEFLHNYGFRGQGMQLCMTDDGFYNYSTLPTFDSARLNNQILGTWDFVTNDASVTEDDSHGMKCFSTIAANMPGSFVGTAPSASFYLYRTEDLFSEYPIEEQNWLAAAERADSLGVDVFSVSLGYMTFDNAAFNYSYSHMNGNTTTIARGVNLAAKKGMLVVAAAGNEGNNAWHYITTPGDADSALTIGAVNISRQPASFSSYGPNSDGQVKPDVAAVGSGAIVAGNSTGAPVGGNGTSFACPIMAGIATCLWQAFPEVTNMQLIQGIRQSADIYNTPDDRTGYGVPDVKKAFVQFIKQLRSFSASVSPGCSALLNYSIKAAAGMTIVIERKLPSDAAYTTIGTQTFSGTFANRVFSFSDSLNNYTSGVNILYRTKMVIGADTSFYIDSVVLSYQTQCNAVTVRKLCPGSATYLSVNTLSGYTYKWQVDNGTGFTDISNNALYSGATSNVLILNNIPQNFYGYQYRCVQTNGSIIINSTPVTIKFTSDWTGAVSTAWEDAANWSCGIVPNQYIDVNVKAGAINFPVVNSIATCHSINTTSGASVLVKSGFKLTVVGQ